MKNFTNTALCSYIFWDTLKNRNLNFEYKIKGQFRETFSTIFKTTGKLKYY